MEPKNGQDFIQKFGFTPLAMPQSQDFFDPIVLSDSAIGFSVKRFYPEGIRYKPAIGQNTHNPDNLAVIWVVLITNNNSYKNDNATLMPIRIMNSGELWGRSKKFDKIQCAIFTK